MKKIIPTLLLSITCMIAYSQSTSVDVTFGTNGVVRTVMGPATSVVHGIAIQSNGKIVAAGTSSDGVTSEFAITRYNSNGSLDSTFGSDGMVTTAFGFQDEAFAVAIQSDGKIVAAGYMYDGTERDFAIARYNVDGTPDSTFDGDGKAVTDIGAVDDEINAVFIQADGKIVAAGYNNTSPDQNNYYPQVTVARYNTNGSLDSTFAGDGIQTTNLGLYDVANSVAVQTDGKIVIGGTHMSGGIYQFLVIRYNSDGSLDNTFNGTGEILTAVGNYYDVAHSIAIQSDGKILVSGTSATGNNYDYNNYNFALVRYNTNGTLDNTFNGDGIASDSLNAYFDISPSVALQDNGKILVAGGGSVDGINRDLAMIRYNSDGTLDTTFDGGDGKIVTNIDGDDDIYSVKIFAGRIYLAGTNDQFLIAAYQDNIFILPVNLLSFTGALQNTTNRLQWQTTGQNISLFKIERSNNGRDFTNIGEQQALTGNAAEKNYGFTDIQPEQGINFYRLKLIESNGSFTYSKVIAIKQDGNNMSLRIFPNPATDLIHVIIPSSQKEIVTVQISNAEGRIIKEQTFTSPGTVFSTSLDVTMLQKGNYFLSVKAVAGIESQKFIKQ